MGGVGGVRVGVMRVVGNIIGKSGLRNGMSLEVLGRERTRTVARLARIIIFTVCCGLYIDGVISCWDAAASSATIIHGSRVCRITRCCWHLVRSFDHACASAD